MEIVLRYRYVFFNWGCFDYVSFTNGAPDGCSKMIYLDFLPHPHFLWYLLRGDHRQRQGLSVSNPARHSKSPGSPGLIVISNRCNGQRRGYSRLVRLRAELVVPDAGIIPNLHCNGGCNATVQRKSTRATPRTVWCPLGFEWTSVGTIVAPIVLVELRTWTSRDPYAGSPLELGVDLVLTTRQLRG